MPPLWLIVTTAGTLHLLAPTRAAAIATALELSPGASVVSVLRAGEW